MHFQRIENHGIAALRETRFVARHKWICETVERIVFRPHLNIYATKSGQRFRRQCSAEICLVTKLTARGTGVQRVLCTYVSTAMPVAGRTGSTAVRTHLHIPEQSLSEQNGFLPIHDIVVQIRRQRNGLCVQRPGGHGGWQNLDIRNHRSVRYARVFR